MNSDKRKKERKLVDRVINLNDEYVDYYNKTTTKSDRIKALSEISSIKTNIQNQADDLWDEVEKLQLVAKEPLEQLKEQASIKLKEKAVTENIESLLTELDSIAFFNAHIVNQKSSVDEYYNKVINFLEGLKDEFRIWPGFYKEWRVNIISFVENYKEVVWLDYHVESLNRISREIVAKNYPEELLNYSSKSEEERAEITQYGSLRLADWDNIFNQMEKLTKQGYSATKASEIVENNIKGIRKAGTIRNKYKGYN